MSRKNKLPDSLELLLDTMCNTFGAIMFIAISLVIISQITTKLVREMQPQEVTEEYLEQLRRKVLDLQNEVAEEERKMAARALAVLGMPKEKKEKVERLLAAKSDNQRLVLELAQQHNAEESLTSDKEKLADEKEKLNESIHQIEVETTQKEHILKQTLQMNQQKKEELEKSIADKTSENSNLESRLEHTPKQTLTFSMEVDTGSARQYTICLKNGRLFREELGEVVAVRDVGNSGHFAFKGAGNVISGNENVALNNLLGGIRQDRFVSIFSDQASYDSLVVLRKYLRSRRLKVNFNHTENYVISFGGGVKASY